MHVCAYDRREGKTGGIRKDIPSGHRHIVLPSGFEPRLHWRVLSPLRNKRGAGMGEGKGEGEGEATLAVKFLENSKSLPLL